MAITINTLSITADRQTMSVSATTDEAGETINKLSLWTESTFKDYASALDFTAKLAGTGQTETFTITATDLGIDNLGGLYFLEFEESTAGTTITATGGVYELTTYAECKLDKILGMIYSGDDCTSAAMNGIVNIDSIITSLKDAMSIGYYQEAISLINILNKLCKNSCEGCPDLKYLVTNV